MDGGGRASPLPEWDIEILRPGIAWLLSLPRDWMTNAERTVLTWLALDSYRLEPAPGVPSLIDRTGLSKNTVEGALASLQRATGVRPALVEKTGRRRARRTVYRLRVDAVPPQSLGRYEVTNHPSHWGTSEDNGMNEAPQPLGWEEPEPPHQPPHQPPQPLGYTHTQAQGFTPPPPTSDGSAREGHGGDDYRLRTKVLGALRAAGVHDGDEASALCEAVLESVRRGETRSPVARLRTGWLDQLRADYGARSRAGEPRCDVCHQPERRHASAPYADHPFEVRN